MNGNQTNQSSSGQQPSSPQMLPAPESKNTWLWPVIAIVIIVIALAYYYYAFAPSDNGEMMVPDNKMSGNDMMPSEEETMENELNAMNMDDLDAELTDIDKELAQ